MTRYAIGLDYGTNSCRSLIVNLDNGAEVASHVYNYPSGLQGVIVDPRDPNVARQNPADYRDGLIAIVVEGLKKARVADPAFSPDAVVGIGVDTTGSTPSRLPIVTSVPRAPSMAKLVVSLSFFWL